MPHGWEQEAVLLTRICKGIHAHEILSDVLQQQSSVVRSFDEEVKQPILGEASDYASKAIDISNDERIRQDAMESMPRMTGKSTNRSDNRYIE